MLREDKEALLMALGIIPMLLPQTSWIFMPLEVFLFHNPIYFFGLCGLIIARGIWIRTRGRQNE